MLGNIAGKVNSQLCLDQPVRVSKAQGNISFLPKIWI
jgi:hypothetical protein